MTTVQPPNTNGGYVQPFQMGADSWFTEYSQALQMGKDIETMMKKNKCMVKKVNLNYQRNLTLVVISQKITKLWQILDRLDALGKNPDRTRITELEQTHRQKLLVEERSRIMQMFMDFQEYLALTGQAARPGEIINIEPEERFKAYSDPDGKFRPNYSMGLGELLYPERRGKDARGKGVTSGTKPLNHSEPSALHGD